MRCPSCDTVIVDEQPSFCPRCGTALGTGDGDVTNEISTGELERDTDTEALTEPEGGEDEAPLLRDFLAAVRRSMRREGLADIAAAAGFSFLVLVACGAVLVLAAKFQYPFLGEGSGPWAILTGIVIVALGVMKVPVHIGDLSVTALPLGALVIFGSTVVWSTALVVRRGTAVGLRDQVFDGMKVSVPFAVICWSAALVFRVRIDPTPLSADATGALILGARRALIFGALGGLRASAPLRHHLRGGLAALGQRWRVLYEGIVAAGVMLGTLMGLALFAGLIWIIVGLLEGRPSGDFGLGEAGAAFIYLVGFGPNVLGAIVAVALGAPIEVGAQVTSSGRLIGPLEEISLFDWGSGTAPWFAFLLLGVPALACSLGGFAARRNARDPGNVVQVLVTAAAAYGVTLFALAALSEARLGAGLIRARGFGRIAPDAASVLLLASAWAIVAGFVGWKIGDAQQPEEVAAPEEPVSEPAGEPEP